ncbi:hypothetical protein DFH06DRAFT_1485631 [Mycena polygramma]|nr:hypothetical protein DFH06DRAFT_1485631 [Mycena polygramma]
MPCVNPYFLSTFITDIQILKGYRVRSRSLMHSAHGSSKILLSFAPTSESRCVFTFTGGSSVTLAPGLLSSLNTIDPGDDRVTGQTRAVHAAEYPIFAAGWRSIAGEALKDGEDRKKKSFVKNFDCKRAGHHSESPFLCSIPTVFDDVSDTIRTNFVGFASFSILVWDHAITFDDEVELIWKGKKGPIIYLFIINRYFTPLGFMVNLFAYLSPTWTVERCTHFIRYEGCTVAIAVEMVGAMMLLRINALYPTRKWITAMLAFLLVVETGINIWLISRGEPVLHNRASGVHACSMVFDPKISVAAAASAWYPLMYDSIVFALTVNRTLPSIRKKEAGYIIKKLFEDGLLYYSVIFAITFVLTFMIVGAPPGVKNIAAQMEQLLTVAMMSRITLSLKKAGRHGEPQSAFLFESRNGADIYLDTFQQTIADGPEHLHPPAANTLKQSDRLIITGGRSPITFAVPPSPIASLQPALMSDSYKSFKAPGPP